MNKKTPTPQNDIWDTEVKEEIKKQVVSETIADTSKVKKPTPPVSLSHADYDLDGLMTDFPTAKELERFVYDETGIVLNLKGRANKLKYQVAMDTLNGIEIDETFIGKENPYIERTEMVPVDPIKEPPERDSTLPPRTEIQNTFYSPVIPHPDEEARAQDKKVHMLFRKYKNGMISYDILGPLEQRPYGEKIDKFGRTRPEVIKWVDPRTGEQLIMRQDGTLTPQGKRLRAMMQKFRVNNTNQWEVWIDREFASLDNTVVNNPWDLAK